MGKKSRAKHCGKTQPNLVKNKKALMKQAIELFKLCVFSPTYQEEWDYYLKVYNAVEEFQKHHSAVLGSSQRLDVPRRSAAIPAFIAWLRENGVAQNFVEIHDFEAIEEYGIVATNDIKEDQELMLIPRKILMTHEDAKNSYLKDLITGNEVLSVMPNVCLALYLHFEKHKPASKYKPYIDILPKEFNTILYFTPEEMKYLKGSAVLSNAIQQYKSIVRQFALLYQVFNGDRQKLDIEKIDLMGRKAFTFDAYRWCVSAVTTRQNKIPVADMENVKVDDLSTLALIPFWDMFNHDVGPMSTSYNPQANQLECFAMRDFKKGEQITICYGSRDNSDLLIHNGFVFTNNQFDKVKIRLGISPQDSLYTKKVQLLNRINCEPSGQFSICSMQGNLPTSPRLVAFLRIFHMNEDELDEWMKKSVEELNFLTEVYVSGSVHFQSDIKMWEYLENRVNLLLRANDNLDHMIESQTLSPRAILSLKLRKEERRVLTACVEFCQKFRKSLLQKPSDSENIKEATEDVKKLTLDTVQVSTTAGVLSPACSSALQVEAAGCECTDATETGINDQSGEMK